MVSRGVQSRAWKGLEGGGRWCSQTPQGSKVAAVDSGGGSGPRELWTDSRDTGDSGTSP